MKRFCILLAAVATLTLSAAAFAGEGPCTASTQECLNGLASHYANYGWAGLEGDYDDEAGTFTVTAVVAHGPAADAGLQSGDVVYGVNGASFASMTEEDWKVSKAERTPGATAQYMFTRDGHKQDADLVLAKMPEDLIAQKVGEHMLEHAEVASVQ